MVAELTFATWDASVELRDGSVGVFSKWEKLEHDEHNAEKYIYHNHLDDIHPSGFVEPIHCNHTTAFIFLDS